MADIQVLLSAAFREAYLELVPRFERDTGHVVRTLWAASVEIMQRLRDGEEVDLVIISQRGVDDLIAAGVLAQRYDLATCGVGVAVKAGAPRPDIATGEALRRAVLAAGSIVYSHGPSGVYLAGLFERMGIAREIESRVRRVAGEPAGVLVARGEAELGFQQICELLPVPGIDLVGPLPSEVQETTTFSAGLHARARAPEAARALAAYFCSPAAAPVIRAKGMSPLAG